MKRFNTYIYIFLVSGLISIFSCGDKDAKGSLEVNYKLEYNNAPLVMLEQKTYPTGEPIHFSRVSFYVAKLTVDNTKVSDIEYLNLTNSHSTLDMAQHGLKVVYPDIKVGSYSTLNFDLGVPEADNDKTPADFDANNVLSNLSEYWTGWKSYIFARLEGQFTANGEVKGFSLHTGGNEAMRSLTLSKDIKIEADKTTIVDVVLHVDKIFGNAPYYDIRTNPQIHAPSQQAQVLQLADGYVESFE